MPMSIQSVNPHEPSDVIVEFEPDGQQGVQAAVEAAKEAFPDWSVLPVPERSQALVDTAAELERRSDEVVELLVREVGKPLTEARAEVERAVAIFRYHSQIALAADGETYPSSDGRSWLLARRHPIGVCGLITPWNFPVAIQAWKTAPALVCGNTVVLKPAPESPAVARLLYEITARHLPDDVFRLVLGDRETGEPLVDHPDVGAVSFTGSVEAGHIVAAKAAGRGAKAQCEMGGQNPSIVLDDADLGSSAETIASAAMAFAGQKCTATSRVIVQAPVYDEFKDRLVSTIENMELFEPSKESCEVGPLVRRSSLETALSAMDEAGGRVLTGGAAPDVEGFYLEPSVIEIDDPANPLAQEEVFGPVAALLKAGDASDAIAVGNGVRYGLSAALFTTDLGRAMSLAPRIEAGIIRINAPTTGAEYYAPFGGSKASSIGPKEQGFAARDFYTETRTILASS
ncbi:MAG: aldehyde dehydrogenase family protein [Actinomycetota bacterium]|nr:aldehyde dehydrogenase family protein [Actinomycetota bacterium]